MMKLLPLVKEDFMGKAPVDIYQGVRSKADTTMQDILEHVVPNYVNGFYLRCTPVESFASEHTTNDGDAGGKHSAKEMLQTLSIEYNRVRQVAITQQICQR